MDYLMGIRGKDFVMIVSDTTAVQQIITIKHDEVPCSFPRAFLQRTDACLCEQRNCWLQRWLRTG